MVRTSKIEFNPIDNTTVITSVSFISICIGLIVFIKKFPLDTTLTKIVLIILSLTTTLFGISAFVSYIDIVKTVSQKNEVLSMKLIAYLIGIAMFGLSAIIVIYPF